MKKTMLVALSLLLMLALALAGCSQPAAQATQAPTAAVADDSSKVIVMGTNAEFEPFEFKNDAGEIVGFDVAIAQEIAKKLGTELKIEDMAFDSLITALSTGKIDMILAGMSVTPDRQESVDFSNTYFYASQVIIVQSGNDAIIGPEDLKGLKVAVQEGTTGDIAVTEYEADGTVVSRFKKGADAVMELINGKVDAVVIDAMPAKAFVAKNPDTIKIVANEFTKEEYAIAVQKGDTELLGTINALLEELQANGRFNEIYEEYIGELE